MPTLKEYNTKIARLRSTRKLTRTMMMVSANKLRKATSERTKLSAYRKSMEDTLARACAACRSFKEIPFFNANRDVSRTLLLVISSDRGLCGGFNNNLLRYCMEWIAQRTANPQSFATSACGRKAWLYLRGRTSFQVHYENIVGRPSRKESERLATILLEKFLAGEYSELYIASNEPRTSSAYDPNIRRILPYPAPESAMEDSGPIFEPDPVSFVTNIFPSLLKVMIHEMIVASTAAEHAARMSAMDNATRNADAAIDHAVLLRNRARQSQITTQLTEIVAGAEAL